MKTSIISNCIKGGWAAAGFSLLLFSVTGCDVSQLQDATEDFGIVIGLEPINTAPTVMVLDAKTNELVPGQITVSYGGPNGEDVIDIFSEPLATHKIKGGIFNFGIENSVEPSATSPARIKVSLQAPGYITRSAMLTLRKTGYEDFEVTMVNKNDAPAGVASVADNSGSASSDGTIQSAISLESNNQSQSSSGVSVRIPQGTVLQDENGEALTGQLTTEVTNYDPTDEQSLRSFPFEASDDEEVGASIVTGISTIEVRDENGRTAMSSASDTSGSNKIASSHTVTFTYRLHSGYQVSEGDLLSFYTFNVLSWSPFEYSYTRFDDIVVKYLGNGQLGVEVQVEQYPNAVCVLRVVRQGELQEATINVNRNGQTGPIYGSVYAFGSYYRINIEAGQNSFTIPGVPGIDYTVYAYYPEYASVGQPWNFHTQGAATIDLPAPPANQIDATVSVSVSCQDPNEKIRVTTIPASSITYRRVNAAQGTRWARATNLEWNYNEDTQVLTGGSFDVSGVLEGEMYRFKISYDGKEYEHDLRITGPTVSYTNTIDDDICQ